MKIDGGFVLTCVDKAIGPQHQKLSWFWKKLCWLRFSWCKMYGERASIWDRRCWWQTTQEKNEEKKEKKMKTRKKEEDYRTAHWLISPKMEWKKNGPLPFLYFFLGFGMSIIKNKPNTS